MHFNFKCVIFKIQYTQLAIIVVIFARELSNCIAMFMCRFVNVYVICKYVHKCVNVCVFSVFPSLEA